MANDLTGGFDVVAEFALPAANRVIAAMHRAERFLHSMSVRVDGTPPRRPDHRGDLPTLVASVDALGEPSVDHDRIPTRPPLAGIETPGTSSSVFDSIVNPGLVVAGLPELETIPIKGRAQLQLSPPTISVPDNTGTNVTVKMEMRCRYFPDKDTPRLAEFIRGDLSITAPVSRVASQVARLVQIDIKGVNVQASFVRTWSSEPVSTADLASVNQLIKNSLRTSFLPSSNPLPSNIAHVQFKTLRGAHDALAVLLNMEGAAANPASHTNVFLGGGDDFAFAAGADFVHAQFQPTIDKISSMTVDPVSFTLNGLVHTWHITYTFKLNSVTLELRNGSILLTIKGHAHTGSWTPDFNFTVKQVITLAPVGSTAELELGDISVDTDSWIIDKFKGRFMDNVRKIRDRALSQSGAQTTVRKALNADAKFGGLLASLLKPTQPKPGWVPPDYSLAYTSAEIRPSGIILHGSLGVTNWAAPHVEFEKIPTSGGSGPLTSVLDSGPDYSALKSWIPGGTIQRYEWSTPGQTQPFLIDENKFVYREFGPGLVAESASPSSTVSPPPLVSDATPGTNFVPGYVPLCVTIRGTRLSTSGPVVAQPVSARICGINSFPVLGDFQLTAEAMPMVALTQPGPGGLVEVTGHAVAGSAPTAVGRPNLVVHFADERSAPNLEVLTQALRESGRKDAATAILVVLGHDQLSKTRYAPGVTYAESSAGNWDQIFGVKNAKRPLTLIAGPKRDVVWKHEGEVDARTLAAALREYLVATGPARMRMLRSTVRIGQSPPNFLFEHAPGAEITLRKLTGRPVTIVFWNKSSKPSIDAVRELEQARGYDAGEGPVILAVNDGESSDAVKQAAAEHKLAATVVPDPKREISRAYGVSIWPTIVSIDATGLVSGIRYGRMADDTREVATPQQSAK
jgi:peroxiredoxin